MRHAQSLNLLHSYVLVVYDNRVKYPFDNLRCVYKIKKNIYIVYKRKNINGDGIINCKSGLKNP